MSNNKVFDIIEQTKQDIQNTHTKAKPLNKVINKPKIFNKTKSLLISAMMVLLFTQTISYIGMFLILIGVGEGRDYITSTFKEIARQTNTTALGFITSILGYLVGRQIGMNEAKKNNVE